jgi:hypothetical protein
LSSTDATGCQHSASRIDPISSSPSIVNRVYRAALATRDQADLHSARPARRMTPFGPV